MSFSTFAENLNLNLSLVLVWFILVFHQRQLLACVRWDPSHGPSFFAKISLFLRFKILKSLKNGT